MSDLLDRVFGPDPDPSSVLPSLPTQGGTVEGHVHLWVRHEAFGMTYWECATNQQVCRATRTEPPEDPCPG